MAPPKANLQAFLTDLADEMTGSADLPSHAEHTVVQEIQVDQRVYAATATVPPHFDAGQETERSG